MTAYAKLTPSDIVGATIDDLGVTWESDGFIERTVIVHGTIAANGKPISAAVLLDGDGNSIASPLAFAVNGVDNYEMACRIAADKYGLNDSHCGLLLADCRTLAEQFAATAD